MIRRRYTHTSQAAPEGTPKGREEDPRCECLGKVWKGSYSMSKSTIFQSCVFVISKNEDVAAIEKLVVRNSGLVRKTLRIAKSKRQKIKQLYHVVS